MGWTEQREEQEDKVKGNVKCDYWTVVKSILERCWRMLDSFKHHVLKKDIKYKKSHEASSTNLHFLVKCEEDE